MTACGKLRRYMRVISSHFPRHIIASLRQADVSSLTPPLKKLQKANGEVEPLATGVDTHTHTRTRALDLPWILVKSTGRHFGALRPPSSPSVSIGNATWRGKRLNVTLDEQSQTWVGKPLPLGVCLPSRHYLMKVLQFAEESSTSPIIRTGNHE